MNINLPQQFYQSFGVNPLRLQVSSISELDRVLRNVDATQYMLHCTPERDIFQDFIWHNRYSSLVDLNIHMYPWRDLYLNDLITLMTTISGNAVCMDLQTGKLYFANYGRFLGGVVLYYDARLRKYLGINEYDRDAMLKGMIPICGDLDALFAGFIDGSLVDVIWQMDSGKIQSQS